MPDASDEEKAEEVRKQVKALKAKNLLIDTWDLDHVEADLAWCGLSGSPTKVHRIQSIVLKKEGFTEVEATEAGVRTMIQELVVDRTLG
jgi:electron transfer flavoprotein beta subunit